MAALAEAEVRDLLAPREPELLTGPPLRQPA